MKELVACSLASGFAVLACSSARPAGAGAGSLAPPRFVAGTAEVGGGELFYETAGAGCTVLFLGGGSAMDSRQWEDQASAFAGDHRVLRVDPRGLGRSARPTAPFAYHDDLAALLDALHVDQAVVVGLSFAGSVVLDFALAHPERARGVVAVAPAVSGYAFSPAMDERLAALRAELARGPEAFLDALLADPHFIPAPQNPAGRERARRLIAENLPALQGGGDPSLVRPLAPPAIERLEELRAPVLLVLGDRDHPDLHELARILEARVPDLERVTIEGSGHTVNLEQPEALTEAIAAFLGRVGCGG